MATASTTNSAMNMNSPQILSQQQQIPLHHQQPTHPPKSLTPNQINSSPIPPNHYDPNNLNHQMMNHPMPSQQYNLNYHQQGLLLFNLIIK